MIKYYYLGKNNVASNTGTVYLGNREPTEQVPTKSLQGFQLRSLATNRTHESLAIQTLL